MCMVGKMTVGGRACVAAGIAGAMAVRWEAAWYMEGTRSNSEFWHMKWEAFITGDEVAFHFSRGQNTPDLRGHSRVVRFHPEGDRELWVTFMITVTEMHF